MEFDKKEELMPQLSLYIDEETLKKVETAARMEHLSISKYVVGKLKESMNKAWPESYENLFGSIDDISFAAEREADFSSDTERENL